jgi:hypothetical protein
VTHEPGLSTAYENRGAIFRRDFQRSIRPFNIDTSANPRISTTQVEVAAMGEGRMLLCGIAFALLPVYASLRALPPPCRSHRRGACRVEGV